MKRIAVMLSGNTMGWGSWKPTVQECIDYIRKLDAGDIVEIKTNLRHYGDQKDLDTTRHNNISIYIRTNPEELTHNLEYHFVEMGCSMHRASINRKYDAVLYFDCPEHQLHIFENEYSLTVWDLQRELVERNPGYTIKSLPSDFQAVALFLEREGINLEELQEKYNQRAIKNGTAMRTERTIALKSLIKEVEGE